MAATVTIRNAAPPDQPAVNSLLREAGLMELDPAAQFGPQYALAFVDGSLAGVAGLERYDDAALLRSVAVAGHAQRQGIGAALTRNRIEWCRHQAMRAVYLLTTTSAPFFAREGFEAIARDQGPAGIASSHQWASACPASSTAMRLIL